MEYRVIESNVQICNGFNCRRKRMFIAERRVTLFRFIKWWWVVTDGEWRHTPEEARHDAIKDADLRKPLSAPEHMEL